MNKQVKKKSSQVRKQANQSAYGMAHHVGLQNVQDYLQTNINQISGKTKKVNSGIESLISRQEIPSQNNSNTALKANIVSNNTNSVTGNRELNNTGSTTICSNRR